MVLLTIIIFVAILALLVLVHELGHFVVAKWSGMKVEEFGFGFPPRIWGIKKGETIFSINWIPLGGFVKIMGENNEQETAADPRSFVNSPAWKRFLVLVAGVVMNIILAAVLLGFGFMYGMPSVTDGLPDSAKVRDRAVTIGQVQSDSPAGEAGLTFGDAIVTVGEQDVTSVAQVQDVVLAATGSELTMTVRRGQERIDITLTPRENPPAGEGATGIALSETGIVSFAWYEALWRGTQSAFTMLVLIGQAFAGILRDLVSGAGVPGGVVSGPIGIAVLMGTFAKLGFSYIVYFAALLSLNLAIINILPLPALDGGRILFLIIGKLVPKSKQVGYAKLENVAHLIGFGLLLLLVVVVTFFDIQRMWDNIAAWF